MVYVPGRDPKWPTILSSVITILGLLLSGWALYTQHKAQEAEKFYTELSQRPYVDLDLKKSEVSPQGIMKLEYRLKNYGVTPAVNLDWELQYHSITDEGNPATTITSQTQTDPNLKKFVLMPGEILPLSGATLGGDTVNDIWNKGTEFRVTLKTNYQGLRPAGP